MTKTIDLIKNNIYTDEGREFIDDYEVIFEYMDQSKIYTQYVNDYNMCGHSGLNIYYKTGRRYVLHSRLSYVEQCSEPGYVFRTIHKKDSLAEPKTKKDVERYGNRLDLLTDKNN